MVSIDFTVNQHTSTQSHRASDVVIVGGGLIGCLTGLRLRDEGITVTIIERGVAGAEASSAAAGILAAQAESPVFSPLFALAIESRDRYRALADELQQRVGRSVGYLECGSIELARTEQTLAQLREKFLWQSSLGHPVEVLDRHELSRLEPQISSEFAGGIRFAKDGQIDPKALTSAVALAARGAGVYFLTGSIVQRVVIEDNEVKGVLLDSGMVPCDRVIVAAGAWSNLIAGVPLAANAIRPARGQIVELMTRSAMITNVVYGEGGYLVPRSDGRVLAGSTLEFVGFQKDVTVAGAMKILSMATALVPSLKDATFSQMWANFRPFSADGAALIGDCGVKGLTIASGHHRSGILLAPVTARYVKDSLTGHLTEPVAQWMPQRTSLGPLGDNS